MLQIVQSVFKPASVEPVVVVGKSTESIQLRTVTVGDDCFVSIIQAVDCSRFIVECGNEMISFNGLEARIRLFLNSQLSGRSICYFVDCGFVRCCLYSKLFFRHYITFVSPGLVVV